MAIILLATAVSSRHNHPYGIKLQITGFQRSGQLLQLLFEELNFFIAHVRIDLLQRLEAFDFRGEGLLDARFGFGDELRGLGAGLLFAGG